jgi:hypothetical protein
MGMCYESNQLNCVDIVSIVLGCKTWGVVPSCLQLICTKPKKFSKKN